MRVLPILFRRRTVRENSESSQPLISTFFSCPSCGKRKMSSIPMGHHAAIKVRQQMNSNESGTGKQGTSQSFATKMTSNEGCPDNPTKYSSKAMMVVWGLYNRYSVHNIKSNINSYDKA